MKALKVLKIEPRGFSAIEVKADRNNYGQPEVSILQKYNNVLIGPDDIPALIEALQEIVKP